MRLLVVSNLVLEYKRAKNQTKQKKMRKKLEFSQTLWYIEVVLLK